MKFRLVVLSLFLMIPALVPAQKKKPPPVEPASYVGYKYVGVRYNKKLPNGVRDLGGALLEDENYGVSRMKKGRTEMLWLSFITGRNSQGVPRWLVKDVLALPALRANEEILQGFSSFCTYNDEEDLNLIVLAENVRDEKTYKIEQAWRANTVTGKFQELNVEDVVCEYDEP